MRYISTRAQQICVAYWLRVGQLQDTEAARWTSLLYEVNGVVLRARDDLSHRLFTVSTET